MKKGGRGRAPRSSARHPLRYSPKPDVAAGRSSININHGIHLNEQVKYIQYNPDTES
jgi:hypothetical protein